MPHREMPADHEGKGLYTDRHSCSSVFYLRIKRMKCWCSVNIHILKRHFNSLLVAKSAHSVNEWIRCFQVILPGSANLVDWVCCWLGGGGRSSMISTKFRGKIPVKLPICPRAQSCPTNSFSWITSPSENDSSSVCSPSKSNLATHLGPL